MIGIEGSFVATVEIDGKKDLLTSEDLKELTVFEEAGNVLPTFILFFNALDESILSQLNDGVPVKVQMGMTMDDMTEVECFTSSLRSVKSGEEVRYYEAKGFVGEIGYLTNHNVMITNMTSGIEAAIEVISKKRKVTGNITKSKDKQKWIQPSIADKSFVNNCLLHCDLQKSVPVYAITLDGFILHDLVKLLKEKTKPNGYDWRFTREVTSEKDILYDSDPTVISNAGLLNNWLGYGRETLVYDMESGEVVSVYEEVTPVLAMSNEIDKSKAIEKRYAGLRPLSSNTHKNYWSSYNHNLQILVALGRIEISLSFSGSYKKIKPLDVVMYSENATSSEQAGEYQSGLYIVYKVIRSIQNNAMTTTVLLCREALNQIKNEG